MGSAGSAGDRPDGFARLTSPLAKRARTILARRESSPFTGSTRGRTSRPSSSLGRRGELVEPAATHSSVDPGAGAFLSARAREVAEAARGGGRSSASRRRPTPVAGSIRSCSSQRLAAGQPASRLDLVAAILRLAPDGRARRSRSAADLPGEVGAACATRSAATSRRADRGWWVAAARVRAPGQDDPAVEARHPRLGPDAGRAARIRLFAATGPAAWHRRIRARDRSVRRPDRAAVDLPTVLMLRTRRVPLDRRPSRRCSAGWRRSSPGIASRGPPSVPC